MNYYTVTNYFDHDELRTAGGKGRDDYFEMLERCGLRRIEIPPLKRKKTLDAGQRLILEGKAVKLWRKALKDLGPGDVLFTHSPVSEKFLAYTEILKEVRKRGCRIVDIVFDLESFFLSDYKSMAEVKHYLDRRTEAEIFRLSDVLICHNEKMKEKLIGLGVDSRRIVCVGIMDYLRDGDFDADTGDRFLKDKPVAFCGNLDIRKSGFVYSIPDGLAIDLYGPGFTGQTTDKVRYRGVYTSLEIMDVMEGSFGLVWDGMSADTCLGSCGEYLRYNNPHKIALYLASGMPVIVWDEAAMAEFVIREGCGMTVSELADIPELLKGLSGEAYAQMKKNAQRIGEEMRRGDHIRSAVEEALRMVGNISEEEPDFTRGIVGKENRNALIIFTREPEAGKTKTRLMPYFSPEQCAELHRCMLKDISGELCDRVHGTDADIIVAYTDGESGKKPDFLYSVFAGGGRRHRRGAHGPIPSLPGMKKNPVRFIRQHGAGIGEKMENAIAETLGMGYEKVILIGTDVPEIESESIDTAFAMLDVSDLVLGPTADGGYYLIGMKEAHHEAFEVKLYGVSTVYEETAEAIRSAGLSVSIVDSFHDIDVPEDIAGFRQRMREDPHLRRLRTGKFLAKAANISVVIPVYNEETEIGAMLRQMRPYSDKCEIIFVDGGSTDGTAERICGEEAAVRSESAAAKEQNVPARLTADGFKYIKCEKGRGRQLNTGALASSGDILFFLHCDSIVPEDFPDEIRTVMARSDWGCFGVKFPSRNLFMLTNRIISNHRAAFRGLPFGDQGIFIDRTLFFESGMFPDQPVMEDYEFSRRVRRYTPAPGLTRKRIISSDRRYGSATKDILRTEILMWHLRHLYRKGVSAEELQQYYRDIR